VTVDELAAASENWGIEWHPKPAANARGTASGPACDGGSSPELSRSPRRPRKSARGVLTLRARRRGRSLRRSDG
jgi:hypothetical protein